MDGKTLRRTAAVAVLSVLVAAMLLATATYAWFTSSKNVSTGRVETKTGYSDLALYVKQPTDKNAEYSNSCELWVQKSSNLMPTSTADLDNFVYCPATAGTLAKNFVLVGESSTQDIYSYGLINMLAEVPGEPDPSTLVAVYLDEPEDFGTLAMIEAVEDGESESLLLNASRLGIRLEDKDDGTEYSRIFYLSEHNNQDNEQINNTVINGELQPEGIVLKYENGAVRAVQDPALPLSACMIGEKAAEPLFYLKPNREYIVQIFFYLEGCDPDCSNSIEFDTAEIGLAFYAALAS